jgi:hypothetical protein
MNRTITTGLIIIVWCIGFHVGSQHQKGSNGVKAKIISVFNDVNWDKQGFVCDGTQLVDINDNTLFYPAKDIDEAIKKLNKVLDEMK